MLNFTWISYRNDYNYDKFFLYYLLRFYFVVVTNSDQLFIKNTCKMRSILISFIQIHKTNIKEIYLLFFGQFKILVYKRIFKVLDSNYKF